MGKRKASFGRWEWAHQLGIPKVYDSVAISSVSSKQCPTIRINYQKWTKRNLKKTKTKKSTRQLSNIWETDARSGLHLLAVLSVTLRCVTVVCKWHVAIKQGWGLPGPWLSFTCRIGDSDWLCWLPPPPRHCGSDLLKFPQSFPLMLINNLMLIFLYSFFLK